MFSEDFPFLLEQQTLTNALEEESLLAEAERKIPGYLIGGDAG